MSLVNVFLRAEMEAEVRRQMASGASFTAFDISRRVQASGISERHRYLKSAVHEMYERGDMAGYTRKLITLPSGEQPYLYFPNPTRINRFAIARTRQTAQNTRQLDPWNRLRVPVKAMRAAGLRPGDSAWVSVNAVAATITITRTPKNGDRLYRVDRYGNLRLAVGKALAALGKPFQIATQQGIIQAQAR